MKTAVFVGGPVGRHDVQIALGDSRPGRWWNFPLIDDHVTHRYLFVAEIDDGKVVYAFHDTQPRAET